MAAKRNYKDSMFRAIFKDKKALLSLYNAIRKTNITDWRAIRLNSLKGVLFNIMRNDLSFTVGEEEIILMEEQSTPNGNMPLRLFFYLAKLYQHSVAQRNSIAKRPPSCPRRISTYSASAGMTCRLSQKSGCPLRLPRPPAISSSSFTSTTSPTASTARSSQTVRYSTNTASSSAR